MQNLFSFGGDTNDTPDSLKMKRAFAQKLMGNMSNAPKNVGEGFNAIGNGLLMGALMGSVNEGEKSAAAKDQGLFSSLMNAFTGGGGQAPAAAPAMPQSEGQTATPTLALSQNAGNGPVNAGVTASPFAKAAYDKFISAGFSPAGAASLVGNTYAESGYNPTLSHDGGTGVGILGFRDPKPGQGRKTALMNFASSRGADWRDPMTQVDYAIHELNTSEKGRGDALRSATDLREANNATISYLRPAGWTPQNPAGGHNYDGRLRFSNAIYDKFGRQSANGQQPVQVAAAGGNVQVPPQQPSGDFLAQREAAQNAPMQAQPQQVAQAPAQQPAPAGMSPQQRAVFSEATRALQSPYASQQTKSAAMMIIQKFIQQEQKTPAQIEKEQLELQKSRGEVGNMPLQRRKEELEIAKRERELQGEGAQPLTAAEREQYGITNEQPAYKTRTGEIKFGPAASKTQVAIDQRQESEFGKETGKALAKRFDTLATDGDEAIKDRQLVGEMRRLGGKVDTGAMASVKSIAANLGIKLDGASDIEAYNALIARLTPQQRVPGSGATSDFDAKMFKDSLPRLINTPEGNKQILDVMDQLAENRVARGDIAMRVQAGELKPNEGLAEIKKLQAEARALSDQFKPPGKGQDAPNAPVGDTAAPVKPADVQPPAIKSQQEYNAMPSGMRFVAPDGSIRVKP